MAGKDFGGKITVTSSLGYKLSLRGTISVMTTAQSNEAITNQDASTDRIMTPVAPSAELSFRDDGGDWQGRMSGQRENLTVVEEQTGVTHLFTGAFWTGRPSINRINGEVSGVQIVADFYRRLG
jgi:hypothetical protein